MFTIIVIKVVFKTSSSIERPFLTDKDDAEKTLTGPFRFDDMVLDAQQNFEVFRSIFFHERFDAERKRK